MVTLNGTYNTATVFTDLVEHQAIDQIKKLLNCEVYKDSQIRIMPDVHAGMGCTIGTTMTINEVVCPNLVGVDIGCGVLVVNLGKTGVNLQKFDDVCHNLVKSGFNVWSKFDKKYCPNFDIDTLDNLVTTANIPKATQSIGSLGGGNHFIELDTDDMGNVYLVIHCGSRHLGLEVAKFHQSIAEQQCQHFDAQHIIDKLKTEGRQKDIADTVAKARDTYCLKVSKDLSYVSGTYFNDYINDMKICQEFATANRWAIWLRIRDAMGWRGVRVETFETIHNYIDIDNMILRKGAVSARRGEKLIIPINMRDGSLICVGKGNDDWNQSAPHGAGRLMSRSKAKETIDLKDFKSSMRGIYSTTINRGTLDESPQAYKPIQSIIDTIDDTVEITHFIKPIYNFKASE